MKDCLSHASSDPRLVETMTVVLSSQMFERFIEERQTEPDHPQIKVSFKKGRERDLQRAVRGEVNTGCPLYLSSFQHPPSSLSSLYLSPSPSLPHLKTSQFFDESIIAKLNRSKTQLKKGDTTFLDDMRDVITETFNPPPPSNW